MSGARNASKISDAIFVSDASNANGSLSSNIRDVINVTMSVTLVMLVRLVTLGSE